MLKNFKSIAKDWAKDQKKRFPKTRAFKALTMCKECYTFYYKNSWHFEKPDGIVDDDDQAIPVRFTQCPACAEQEVAFYEMESSYSY